MCTCDSVITLHEKGIISHFDFYFAQLMGKLSFGENHQLLINSNEITPRCLLEIVTAFLSKVISNGDTYLNVQDCIFFLKTQCFIEISIDSLLMILRTCSVIGQPGEWQPIILDQDALYIQRYWEYEQQLATNIIDRACLQFSFNEQQLKLDLNRLFYNTNTVTNWQKVAATIAVLKGICVISGGPGTGKTSTIIKILELLVSQYNIIEQRTPRVILATPTGKAAARIQQLIQNNTSLKDIIRACTLHRLLQSNNTADINNLTNLDLLVIDEISMVSLALLTKVVNKLPMHARLILSGDKDQLASVQAGAVLRDLCLAGKGNFSEDMRSKIMLLTGELISKNEESCCKFSTKLSDVVIYLENNFRFQPNSGIGILSELVRTGNFQDIIKLTNQFQYSDIDLKILNTSDYKLLQNLIKNSIIEGLHHYLNQLNNFTNGQISIDQLLETLDYFKILCVTHDGQFGVKNINKLCEKIIKNIGIIDTEQEWYLGKPVMIMQNDYELNLFNGDTGITVLDSISRDHYKIYFKIGNKIKSFTPECLPKNGTAFAITVHKSQGSEFISVLVLIPPTNADIILNRALIYTAITRAKEKVTIYYDPVSFNRAIEQQLNRSSGLLRNILLK